MFESFEPRTGSLNATNVGLGLLVLLCCLILVRGILEDLLDRLFRPKSDFDSARDSFSPSRGGPGTSSRASAFPDKVDSNSDDLSP